MLASLSPRRLRRDGLTPEQYRRVCIVAFVLLCAIVVTGAAVRLTNSGLGCVDWPNCNNERLIDVSSTHAAIEQLNHLFTGLVALGVIAAVLGSRWRRPRRRDLTWLSWGLVVGVIGQVILGAIVVWVDLHPAAVQQHFVLSMILCANSIVLIHRAGEPDDGVRRPTVAPRTKRRVNLLVGWMAVTIVAGTVVTGTGPHAGDEKAPRFEFLSIPWATRIHGVIVWITVFVAAALLWHLRTRARDRAVLDGPLTLWCCVALAQGALGYWQYATGVPPVKVGFHIAGATALWSITVWMWCVTTRRSPSADEMIDDARATARAARTAS